LRYQGRPSPAGPFTPEAPATTVSERLRSLSIVIPAYNEETRLGPTLEAILAYLRAQSFEFGEVIVVDDGSADATAALVAAFAERDPAIRLVRNPGNRGKGFSVRNGVLAAAGDWILSTDADLSTPIEELAKLVNAAWAEGAVIAIGSRALDRSLVGVRQSAVRELGGRVFNLCARLVTGIPFLDTQCGFKLFEASAAREIFQRQRLNGFSFDVEDLYLARRLGHHAVEVPVQWNNAAGTKVSGYSGLQSFVDLLRIGWGHRR
jgi:dolichyl-phosphate beta-glucosyltransferase